MLAAIFGIACGICGFILGWNEGKQSLLRKLAEKDKISVDTFKNEMEKLL